MNLKEYIESGILEAYVLGALTEQERTQVEADIAMYPEVAAEVAAIELSMQQFATTFAEEPPAHMQEQIWNAINDQGGIGENNSDQSVPPPQSPKTIPLAPQVAAPKPSWQRAAVWAAIIVSVLTNFMLLSQRNKAKEDKDALVARVDSMAEQQKQLASAIDAYKKGMDMVADASMQTVVMRKEGMKDAAGMVFWSKEKGEVYLALHNVPMPPQGKQYQLWVIQDGKPVDMGVISNDMVTNSDTMQKIAMAVQSGQAFAISIEKEGGNPTPTEVFMVGATS